MPSLCIDSALKELSEAPYAANASCDVTAQRLQMRLYIPWTDRDLALFRDFLSGFSVIPKFHLYGRLNSFLLAFSFSNKINDIFKNMFRQVLCHLQFWITQSTKLNIKCVTKCWLDKTNNSNVRTMYAFHKESLKLHGKFHDYINNLLLLSINLK